MNTVARNDRTAAFMDPGSSPGCRATLYRLAGNLQKGTVSGAQGLPWRTFHRWKRNGGIDFFAERGMSEDAAFLREQARRCRRLARGFATPDVAETLSRMAKEYDARAEELEKK